MAEEKKIMVRVVVAERPFSLSIFPSQEQAIREAAKRLQKQYAAYREQGVGADEFGSLIAAALQIVTPLIDAELKDDRNQMISSLQKINNKVEEYISITGE